MSNTANVTHLISIKAAALLGLSILIGLAVLGYQLSNAAISVKQFERSVSVKGLAEQEVQADIVLWPIQFVAADNDLQALYVELERQAQLVQQFLTANGLADNEITVTAPSINDRSAQQWGNEAQKFRYAASQTVTVYSQQVQLARQLQAKLSQLGKQGIVFNAGNYNAQTEYIYTHLNTIKPQMIERATRNARDVAEKFAKDSDSQLGKIKRASQGQFSITARDKNNPQIKKVRVVSTVEYYLSD
ncbi:MAG: SIMPL domain-containing protein [Pseudomonadales bacterium]|nr:SIMPL domain-containing protein [Pseudomonadales bacterium]